MRTQQFGIIDLFAMVTVAALVSAMLAPLVREMKSEHRSRMVGLVVFQVVIAAGIVAFFVRQRRKTLEKTGRRILVAYCGEVEWRDWPVFLSLTYMLLLTAAQLLLAIGFATKNERLFGVLLHQLQLGYFTGWIVARCMWRAYPNSMEFFENGIVLSGTAFFPWKQVQLRPSQFFADRIAVVYFSWPTGLAQGGDTIMALVPGDLQPKLFAVADAAPWDEGLLAGKPPSPAR